MRVTLTAETNTHVALIRQSQSCAVAKTSGEPLDNQQMTGRNKSFQSLVFVLTQPHFGQWNSLPFCLPSLITARNVH